MIFFCLPTHKKVATTEGRYIETLNTWPTAALMINLFKHSITTLIWNVNSIWMEVGLTIEYLMIATLSCRWMEIAYHWVARSDSFLIFCYALCQMPDRRRRSSLRPTANIASHVAAINYGFPRRSTQPSMDERRHWLPKTKVQAFHSSSKNLLNPKFDWRVFLRDKL